MPRQLLQTTSSTLRPDGSTTKVVFANTSGLPIFSQSGYSVVGRFKYWGTTTVKTLYAEANSGSDIQLFHVSVDAVAKKIIVTVRNNANVAQVSSRLSTTTVDRGIWYDFVWTDNNGTAKLYINGVLDATDYSYTPAGTYNLNRSAVGMIERLSPVNPYLGWLSDFRVFNRVLTAQEAANFHSGISITTGAKGIWLLNDGSGSTAADTSGNGNTGTITSSVWSTTEVPFKARTTVSSRIIPRNFTSTLRFDGATSRISATAISGLSTGHSITGWVRPNGRPAGLYRVITNNIESSSNLETVTLGDDLIIRAGYYNGTVYTRASSQSISAHQWNFFTYTWNGSTARLIVNGVVQSGNLAPQSNTTTGLNIGGRSDSTFLLGAGISEIRYFNRPITDNEALQMYTSNVIPSGCVRQYYLNEGTGTVATDTSGSGVNGTITAPTWLTTDAPSKTRTATSGRQLIS